MQAKRFQRTIEDFVCERCGKQIHGNGYTNHCPHCLWSKHVDVNPGDRRATCGGLMKPVGIFQKHGMYTIRHQCVVCGHERVNVVAPDDDFDVVIKIATLPKV